MGLFCCLIRDKISSRLRSATRRDGNDRSGRRPLCESISSRPQSWTSIGFGRSILGYDCYAGEDVPFEDDLDLSAGDWRELTNEPRRYGFHATLKAPFHLASNCTETQLTDALLSFAKSGHQEMRFEPGIRALGDFIAIVPREASPLLNALANACTITFDAFRAPMTAHERERRAVSRLSEVRSRTLIAGAIHTSSRISGFT